MASLLYFIHALSFPASLLWFLIVVLADVPVNNLEVNSNIKKKMY